MSTEIASVNLASRVESALIEGDLSRLTTEEKVKHYLQVCESIGLNPHTKPFGYIVLSQKLTLYALRACTDQLRTIHGVSVTSIATVLQGGILTVTARVRDKSGREDSDIGCVFIDGMRGDLLANAHMRAVTKAKRRATLSLCGLGWLDESETDSIPGSQIVPDPDPRKDVIVPPIVEPAKALNSAKQDNPDEEMEQELITSEQMKEITRLKKLANFTPAEQIQWKNMVRDEYHVESPKELTYEAAETIINDLIALTTNANGER